MSLHDERWDRLKELFERASEMSAAERARFAAKECAGDPEMRERLEAMLKAHDEGTGPLDHPIVNLWDMFPEKRLPLVEGDMLMGQFKIVRALKSGGMGDVYEALDTKLAQGRIALKAIRPKIANDPQILARFTEEVLLARQVTGPNVCRIHTLYLPEKAAGEKCAAFLTMEFLDGDTLAERIKRGPVPPQEAMAIAVQLCQALQTIHKAGVIHRDLKPLNIMLVPHHDSQKIVDSEKAESEKVVVMDFGLAKAFTKSPSVDETGMTIPGTIMGTPEYMAPEQFVAGAEVSPATDIYSLGIVLYELVTGKQLFAAPTLFASAVRRGRRPDSPSSIRRGLPPVWDDVIGRCLEYEPARRYQSANQVIDALHQHTFVVWRFREGERIALTRRSLYAIAAVVLVLVTFGGRSWYVRWIIHTPPLISQHWYDRGMTALRDGTYLGASRAFTEAVSFDKNYALAHARLAETWAELDFTGKAREEILIASAPEQANSMPDLDRDYVNAVRKTLVRDYSAAAQGYEEILKRLPNDHKAEGYVDLGRAYEKAGRVNETIAAYEKAAQMRPDDPAPFVHLGILKSRQRDPVTAEVAFAKAEALYEASSKPEGLAEVAYERGYAANEEASHQQARKYLDKSLAIARQIPSVQLEVRSLSQLSSLEYNSGSADKAIEYANQVIQLARDNGLEYWSADGLMRLGNAYFAKEDYVGAESSLQQALHLAQQNQHPRIEATAELTLASIRDQQGKPDEQIAYAKDALQYFRDFGFMNMAADAAVIVVRGEEAKGDFAKALNSGTELIRLAESTNSALSTQTAEEAVGNVSVDLERYPSALAHFEKALKAARTTQEGETYMALDCADSLWRLGRYPEADEAFLSVAPEAKKRSDTVFGLENTRAQMLLSKKQYQAALGAARGARKNLSNASASNLADLLRVETLAEAQLGQLDSARRNADLLLNMAQKEGNADMIAKAELVGADVSLRSHDPARAIVFARSAESYFSVKGQDESDWLSLYYSASAARELGELDACRVDAKHAHEILAKLEQSWGSVVFHQYATRPDHQERLGKLVSFETI